MESTWLLPLTIKLCFGRYVRLSHQRIGDIIMNFVLYLSDIVILRFDRVWKEPRAFKVFVDNEICWWISRGFSRNPVGTIWTHIIIKYSYQAKWNCLIDYEHRGPIWTKQMNPYLVRRRGSFFHDVFNQVHWPHVVSKSRFLLQKIAIADFDNQQVDFSTTYTMSENYVFSL